jgi:hypothetical protein
MSLWIRERMMKKLVLIAAAALASPSRPRRAVSAPRSMEHEQLDDFCPNCLVPVVGVGLPTNSEFSGTRYGATVGAGIEYALGAK